MVDDDPTIQVMLEGVLQSEGYDVVLFDDAETALVTLAEIAPSLVLLDIELPGTSGLDALRVLRVDSDVPVVAYTGASSLVVGAAGPHPSASLTAAPSPR